MNHITHWIDGKPWVGDAERRGTVFDPATGRQTGEVDLAADSVVDEAVAAARQAFGAWRSASLATRSTALFALRALLASHVDDLADLVTAEHGKVMADAAGEVARGLEVVEFACGIPHLLKGEFSEGVSTGVNVHSVRQPLGVVAGITPFNFPVMVPLWMFPLAIACGNTFVLKPSEKDPSASLLLAELVAEAGFPDGVFNVVQGDKVAVDRILTHPDIAAVSFVGSTPVARHVYETAASGGKRVQALGGAKNHMVVLPDADMAEAAEAAVSAGYGSAGERCMAVSVLVAVGGCGDALVQGIRRRVDGLAVGAGTDPESEMGPLITAQHRERVASYLDIGEREGASVVIDGRAHPSNGDEGGYWLGPCLIDGVSPDMQVYRDEYSGRCCRSYASIPSVRRSTSSGTTATAMVRPSSPATVRQPSGSRPRWRRAWSASTSPFRSRSPPIRSGDGRDRSSVTSTSTGPTASASTRGARRSPAGGTE